MQIRSLAFALCISVLPGCGADPSKGSLDYDPDARGTIETGAYGVARHLTGNHQPGTGPTSGTTEPASGRKLRVHAVVSAPKDATDVSSRSQYGRYVVHTAMVATAGVDADGFFQVALAPGTYSVFLSDGDAWFCNLRDDVGLCAVTIAAGNPRRFDINVDYDASY